MTTGIRSRVIKLDSSHVFLFRILTLLVLSATTTASGSAESPRTKFGQEDKSEQTPGER